MHKRKYSERNKYHHLYGARWRRERDQFLKDHPLCKFHMERGKLVPATVVDHEKPHKGDPKIFWDKCKWQGLCKHCHDSHKQRLEKSGTVIGCDANGMPLDPNHHWNK